MPSSVGGRCGPCGEEAAAVGRCRRRLEGDIGKSGVPAREGLEAAGPRTKGVLGRPGGGVSVREGESTTLGVPVMPAGEGVADTVPLRGVPAVPSPEKPLEEPGRTAGDLEPEPLPPKMRPHSDLDTTFGVLGRSDVLLARLTADAGTEMGWVGSLPPFEVSQSSVKAAKPNGNSSARRRALVSNLAPAFSVRSRSSSSSISRACEMSAFHRSTASLSRSR
ncbi:hypothetical protein DFJ74DRAFT_687659 [Hyaloraphidium curvatum]|nr:hypothetical protein DFJ74DRAFT_687659 [Hyaloraphidium curvatum]